jgi:hypothetical protein
MAEAARAIGFFECFSGLTDPRQAGKVLYPLNDVMLLVLCGELAGVDGFVEVDLWGETNLEFLRRLLPFARGIPSHEALNDLFNAVDYQAFRDGFVRWAESLRTLLSGAPEREVVAIDGKTSRRSGDASKGRAELHLVSAWASAQRLVLGQEAIQGEENEIVAIPRLLEMLELTCAVVIIEATGCQRAIAKKICESGADYLLPVKDNQPDLKADIELLFTEPRACGFGDAKTLLHQSTADIARLAGRRD